MTKTLNQIIFFSSTKIRIFFLEKKHNLPFKLNGRSLMCLLYSIWHTGTCFIQKIYAPSSSLLQGKHLPFSSSPLRLTIFRLFVILSLTQLYRYTSEIFLFSSATFKYTPSDEWTRIFSERHIFYF